MDITNLYEPFDYPPFYVLDTRLGKWPARQKAWRAAIGNDAAGRNKSAKCLPDKVDWTAKRSISEFDPVLAELMIHWFSRKGDLILDPFAGGATRGLVAGIMGRDYLGYDVYESQVSANEKAWDNVNQTHAISGTVIWGIADSAVALPQAPKADMVFTCPPYFNLEKYGTQDNDISNSPDYRTFRRRYADILLKAEARLKDNSFFVVVVSEVRGVQGASNPSELRCTNLVGLVPETIDILTFAGLRYYNELVLVNQAGTLPMRAYQYMGHRKVGRQHQNVLVFYKGDIAQIENKFTRLW